MLTNRNSDDTNILRSHYYILKERYDEQAIPLHLYDTIAYLHKRHRGFAAYHFTHLDFISIIKVLSFRYFHFQCTNLNDILGKSKETESCIMDIEVQEIDNTDSIPILSESNTLLFNKRCVAKTNTGEFFNYTKDAIKNRNIWLCSMPDIIFIESKDPLLFNYAYDKLNIIHFFNYIKSCFKANISSILQNPILSVYSQISISFEIYKMMKQFDIFTLDIMPSMYDFLITYSFFGYIRDIDKIDTIYTTVS